MPATLQQFLLAPEALPSVLTDCDALIDEELSEKSGVSGTAVKLAYKAVTSFAPGYYRARLEELLPQFIATLEPYWLDFRAAGGSEFGDYLAKHGDAVSESLLSVTDAMAASSKRPVIIKAYKSVRSNASRHVQAALPRVGTLVLKYAG